MTQETLIEAKEIQDRINRVGLNISVAKSLLTEMDNGYTLEWMNVTAQPPKSEMINRDVGFAFGLEDKPEIFKDFLDKYVNAYTVELKELEAKLEAL